MLFLISIKRYLKVALFHYVWKLNSLSHFFYAFFLEVFLLFFHDPGLIRISSIFLGLFNTHFLQFSFIQGMVNLMFYDFYRFASILNLKYFHSLENEREMFLLIDLLTKIFIVIIFLGNKYYFFI